MLICKIWSFFYLPKVNKYYLNLKITANLFILHREIMTCKYNNICIKSVWVKLRNCIERSQREQRIRNQEVTSGDEEGISRIGEEREEGKRDWSCLRYVKCTYSFIKINHIEFKIVLRQKRGNKLMEKESCSWKEHTVRMWVLDL